VKLISQKTDFIKQGIMDIDHFDPWWNLTVEDQATDRTHGIGQSNIVEIIDMAEETSLCHSLFI
jgi:hypothetical protein